MKRFVPCSGNCGRLLPADPKAPSVYIIFNTYFCYHCATKLPKCAMKKCNQCVFFRRDGDQLCFCTKRNIKIRSSNDACLDYEKRPVSGRNNIRKEPI